MGKPLSGLGAAVFPEGSMMKVRLIIGVVLVAAAVGGGWWALALVAGQVTSTQHLVPPLNVGWVVLPAVALIALILMWNQGDDVGLSKSKLHSKKHVTTALQAVFPKAAKQEADRTPLHLDGFKHTVGDDKTETLVCKLPAGMNVDKLAGSGRAAFLAEMDLDVDSDRVEITKDQGRERWLRITIKPVHVPLTTRATHLGGTGW